MPVLWESTRELIAHKLLVEAKSGITYAYCRFGNRSGGALPLVCPIHFRGNLDSWDPILIDTIANQLEVIPVDNASVVGSAN